MLTPNPGRNTVEAAPVLDTPTDGTPISDGTLDATVDTDIDSGTLYWAALTDGGSATNQQIKAGAGGDIVVAGQQAVSANGTQTVPEISGLASDTAYTLVFLQTNSLGSDSNQEEVALTTAEVALTSATDGTPTDDGATDAGVTTDTGNGVLYWAVVTDGGEATDAELEAGAGGDIVPGVAGNQEVETDGAQTIADIEGLETGTTYQIKFLQRDRTGNASAQASVSLTTL